MRHLRRHGSQRSAEHGSRVKRLIPAFLTVLILGAMAVYAANQSEMLRALTSVSPAQVGLLIALAFGGLFAQAQQFRTALAVSDIEMGSPEATGLTAVNTMANYYVPAHGGTVLRGAYMHEVHAMSVSAYAMLTIVTVVVGLVVAVSVGLGATVVLSFSNSQVGVRTLLPFIGVLALVGVGLGIVVASAKLLARSKRLSDTVARMTAAAKVWRNEPVAGLKLVGWTVVVLLFQSSRLFVAFLAVGAGVSALEMLLIGSLVSMSFVLSITPGNLGIKEGVTALAGAIVGVPLNVALAASLVDRGTAFAVTFTVGVISLVPLMRRAAAANRTKDES